MPCVGIEVCHLRMSPSHRGEIGIGNERNEGQRQRTVHGVRPRRPAPQPPVVGGLGSPRQRLATVGKGGDGSRPDGAGVKGTLEAPLHEPVCDVLVGIRRVCEETRVREEARNGEKQREAFRDVNAMLGEVHRSRRKEGST